MPTNFPDLSLPHARRARGRVADDLRALARDSERLLAAMGEDLGEKARSARSYFGDTMDTVRERYSDWQDRGVKFARQGAARVDRSVRENPYPALGVVFGLGLLVGWLVAPRRR